MKKEIYETKETMVKPNLSKKEEMTLEQIHLMLLLHIDGMNNENTDYSSQRLPEGEMVKMLKYIKNLNNLKYEKCKYYRSFLGEILDRYGLVLLDSRCNINKDTLTKEFPYELRIYDFQFKK